MNSYMYSIVLRLWDTASKWWWGEGNVGAATDWYTNWKLWKFMTSQDCGVAFLLTSFILFFIFQCLSRSHETVFQKPKIMTKTKNHRSSSKHFSMIKISLLPYFHNFLFLWKPSMSILPTKDMIIALTWTTVLWFSLESNFHFDSEFTFPIDDRS